MKILIGECSKASAQNRKYKYFINLWEIFNHIGNTRNKNFNINKMSFFNLLN